MYGDHSWQRPATTYVPEVRNKRNETAYLTHEKNNNHPHSIWNIFL